MRGLPAGPGGPLRKSNGRSPASLGADIEEIDALLAASKRARTSVAERASKLMSEHAAVQRGFERELDRETLRQKPKEKLKRRSGADHALLFHLAHAPDQPADEAAAELRERDGGARALDRGRDAEDGAARRLAETMAELEAAPGWAALVGDVDDEADGEDADVAAEQAAEVDALDETRRKREAELAAVRRASGAEIAARLDAYDPVGPRAPGHEHRLRDLGLKYPSPAYAARPSEARSGTLRRRDARIAARAASAPAPAAAVDDGPSEEERAAALEADAREARRGAAR
ncbi:hypothetical protein SO694_00016364 [Aureococcus anophagefferens]|uniref:Uncharacterized protein n=1 Tax=Aureococcus anophagefferens TaxID=44056 RepID=A0ABR1G212_AURAN